MAENAPPSFLWWYATSRSLYPSAMPTSTRSYGVTAGQSACAPSAATVRAASAGSTLRFRSAFVATFWFAPVSAARYKTTEIPACASTSSLSDISKLM